VGRSRYVVAIVLALSTRSAAWAWEVVLPSDLHGSAPLVAVDPAGDVIAAGATDGRLTVLKLRGDDGHEIWRYQWPADPSSRSAATGLALRNGDPVVTGFIAPGMGVVARLSSATGEEIWRWSGSGAFSYGYVVVDPAGDVVSSTWLEDGPLTVVKRSGTDGAEHWRRSEPEAYSSGIAVDAAGDVLLAATPVVKLGGGRGDLVWEDKARADRVATVLLTPSGDVVVARYSDRGARSRSRIMELDGTTGRARWTTRPVRYAFPLNVTSAGDVVAGIDHRDRSHPRVARFRSTLIEFRAGSGRRRPRWRVEAPLGTAITGAVQDASGDLVVSAIVPNGGAGQYPPTDSIVLKVRGTTGRRAWIQPFRGPGHPDGVVAYGIGVDPHGDVVVGGYSGTSFRFTVAKLSATTGAE
jgi:putative pyrroloquinoline-quinone binding quinoprotein